MMFSALPLAIKSAMPFKETSPPRTASREPGDSGLSSKYPDCVTGVMKQKIGHDGQHENQEKRDAQPISKGTCRKELEHGEAQGHNSQVYRQMDWIAQEMAV